MKLADWLKQQELTAAEFGRRINRGRSAVTRWANGDRIPDAESMSAIGRETAGAVTPNDFFDMPAVASGPDPGDPTDPQPAAGSIGAAA